MLTRYIEGVIACVDHPVILISDDDPLVTSALDRQATRAGLWVVSDHHSQVHAMAKVLQPTVIILDLHQSVHGITLLDQLKGDPETRDVRVIVLSANADDVTRRLCLEKGAAEFVTKPFDTLFVTRVAGLAGSVSRERMTQRKGPVRRREPSA